MSKQKLHTRVVATPAPSKYVQQMMGSKEMRQEGQHSVKLTPIGEPAADGSIAMGIDVGNAPIPTRRYAAELCWVSIVNHEAKFVFAQPYLIGDGLESAVVIRMNPASIANLADSIRQMTSPNLDEVKSIMRFPDENLHNITERPAQIASMFASVVGIAYSGFDTCCDFYQASAFAVRKSEFTGMLDLEPVVRVEMRTALFIPLMQKVLEIDVEFRKTYTLPGGGE
jgi:hypothetical protein